MSEPWSDWIPGALSKKQLKLLCKDGYITNVAEYEDDKNGPIDYSALDLTISNKAYQMARGSVKPFGDRYEHSVTSQGLAEPLEPNGDGAYVLERTKTYLFKLREIIRFKEDAKIHGQATAKSTNWTNGCVGAFDY